MDKITLLAMPKAEYMNEEQLAFFDQWLQVLTAETLAEIETARSHMVSQTQVSDVSDRATQEESAMITLRIADRKRQLLPKIQAARQRIRDKEYGYCLQTGEPIGLERLLIRPTAEYCTDAKKLNEQREHFYEHSSR